MSRIDQALEKAARLREAGTTKHGVVVDNENKEIGHPEKTDIVEFIPGDTVVDRDTVDHHIVTITDPASPAAEEYKKLRARVLKSAEKGLYNTLLITSAKPAEGKTVTAINLAVAIAQELDRTVLLIDADLRKPSVASYLGIQKRLGLSDYLQARVDIADVLIKTGIGRLVVMPAGTAPDNPAELLGSQRMRDLVRDVKGRYRDRFIILDAPPLLFAADAISLANYVDGVLFVVQAGSTTQKIAGQALSLIKDCNILGTVFNNVPSYLAQDSNPYYRYQQTNTAARPDVVQVEKTGPQK